LNFGRDEGWSYVSAGMGTARITTERADSPLAGTADRCGREDLDPRQRAWDPDTAGE